MKRTKRSESFGKVAKEYDKYRKPHPKAVFNFFFSLIKRPTIVLDLGCGTGKSTEPLARKDVTVFGCDPDPQMLKEARRRANLFKLHIVYRQGRAERLHFLEDAFDAVTIGSAFHWFATKKVLREIRRVLKPEGLLFIFNRVYRNRGDYRKEVEWKLFRRYGISTQPVEEKSLRNFAHLLRSTGFRGARTKRIPIKRRYNLEERVGVIKSTSAYALLNPRQQEEVIDNAEKILKAKLGKKKHFVIPRVMNICYGYKPKQKAAP